MGGAREIDDSAGRRWSAALVSGGRTSGYLNPRVHRPVVRFTCLSGGAARYASLPPHVADLAALSENDLLALLDRARPH